MHDGIFATVVSIASGLLLLATFFTRLGTGVRAFVTAPYYWVREQSTAAKQIRVIVKELTTNSGSSLKDAVLRIDAKVNNIDEQRHEDGQHLWAMCEDHPDGVFECDATGSYKRVNRTLCRTLDRQVSELLGRGWEQCISPESRASIVDEWDRCMLVCREFNRSVHCLRPDGTHVWLHFRAYGITNRVGSVTGYMGYARLIEPGKQPHSQGL